MKYWILKTEPSVYSFDDLMKDKTTTWDGVKNPFALANIRSMKPGDQILIYHSNVGKCIVGLAEVIADPYPDPKKKDKRQAVVDIRGIRKTARPVSLSDIKACGHFHDLKLVRVPRLSVIPVSADHWKRLMAMAGE